MGEKDVVVPSMQQLRLRCAVNSFKSVVLKEKHVARQSQVQAMINALEHSTENMSIFDKTWGRWFSEEEHSPQATKLRTLDEIAATLAMGDHYSEKICATKGYADMVRGGLMKKLLAPTKSSNPLLVLIGRANDYEPVSPLHLHLDAIEVAGSYTDFGALPWSSVVAVAATRVLECVAERWGARQGSVYSTFPSDFYLKWNAASPERREEMRSFCRLSSPDLFPALMQPGGTPDWRLTGVSSDIPSEHIYKLLFSLAADPDFLVADRLQIWVIDMATSALAMHAFAWIDRYTTMGIQRTDEFIYWAAFYEIFFHAEPIDADGLSVALAMERSPATWDESSFTLFKRAREIYHRQLRAWGLSPAEIWAIVQRTREERCLEYSCGG